MPTTVGFLPPFSQVQEPFRTGSRFLSSLGRTEQCHSIGRILGHQKEYRGERGIKNDAQRPLGLSAWEMQPYKLPGVVQLGKQTTLLPGKCYINTQCRPWRRCHQDTVIKCRQAYICATGLLCIPLSITSSLPSHHLLVLSNLALPGGKNSRWLFSI